jgi:hypothetical protein
MKISPLDLAIALLFVALVYALAVGLARTAPNSGIKSFIQTTAGKLVIIITSLALLCTLAFAYIVFIVGC